MIPQLASNVSFPSCRKDLMFKGDIYHLCMMDMGSQTCYPVLLAYS